MKIVGLPGNFISRAEMGLRPPRSFSRNINPARGGWMIHYGGPPQRADTLAASIARWRSWQNFHMAPGWAGTSRGAVDIAYTIGVDQLGNALAGRGFFVRTAANGTSDANGRFYAVAAILGEGETPSQEMIAALAAVVQHGRNHGDAADGVLPHSHVRQTACPGSPLRSATADWSSRRDLVISPTPRPPLPKEPEMNPEQDRRLRDVERDIADTKNLVEQLIRALGGRYTAGNPSVGTDLSRLRLSVRAIAAEQGLETEHPVEQGPVGA